MKHFTLIDMRLVAVLLMTLTTVKVVAQAEDGTDVKTITTVADAGTSGMCLASFVPEADYAIDAESAEVLSMYTVMGRAIFTRLLVRGGKHYVKAGAHVIIKTKEPMAVTLEPSDGRSTLLYDDIISPEEDTPVEDFRANHPVAEGEYIYMLTNMEKNGGFGFTYFTGKTMKKGNFYIVSTREPEKTGIKAVNSTVASIEGAVYNLQGMRVLNPVEGQIYIQNGRKFVKRNNATSASSLEQPSIIAPVVTRAVKDIEDGDPVPFLPGDAGDEDGF